MNEELSYAEMLEIPVETVTVNRTKRKKKEPKETEPDLKDRLVEQVNDRMQETEDPLFAQSLPIEREETPVSGKEKRVKRLLIGEFAAVCALCAAIFLTNIFLPASAINTFVRGLFHGEAEAADTRTYADFTLSPVVNDYVDAEMTVSDTGILSFTAQCTVYAPCEGEVASVNGDDESGYTVELKHSDSFSTILSGLDDVYFSVGQTVKSNVPLAYSDGEGSVRVMFYENGNLLTGYTVAENTLAWS